MWKQTKPFDLNKAGKEPGKCLKNSRLGYDIAAKYANAWTAWLNTEQHTGRDYPAGVDVPIYFWYINANKGHIGVRLASGKFWTDGRIFDSVEAYEAAKAPNFVGWGESINEVRVIEHVVDPTPIPKMPSIGARVQFAVPRTAFVAGTTTVKGTLPPDIRIVRGYDPKYPNRIIVNSASVGNGVAVALYYTNGNIIPGWKVV